MAPATQQELTRLESVNAPIQDQLDQAAIFAGLNPLGSEEQVKRKIQNPNRINSGYHGRQEYIFRWLLRKWSAEGEKGYEARICPNSWRIFTRCLEIIPTRTSARILHERKFYQSLRRTVEECLENTTKGSICKNAEEEKKISKKRKRHGTPSEIEISSFKSTLDLRQEVLNAILHIVSISELGPAGSDAFEGDYMRSVIRMATDEAGQIFGGWLKWNLKLLPSSKNIQQDWLAPFAEIWTLHVVETQDSQVFSKFCLKPVLELLKSENLTESFRAKLEQLMAQNIIMPARAFYDRSSNGDLLKSLVGDIVLTDPSFASIVFDVTVRCIQPHRSRRRRPNEIAWLQKVFEICNDSIIGSSEEKTSLSSLAQSDLLKGALNSHVKLDLSLLRIIVSRSAFGATETDWSIVATAIAMDSNVFLIPDPGTDLFDDLLKRITNATVKDPQRLQQNQICSTIILPLMGEFAKARNLIGFVHHWYDQLKQFENLRLKAVVLPLVVPDACVWEDERLQGKLKELMELALTTQQIAELVAWLESKWEECSSAVYVISDAIASAATRDETIDVVKEYLRSSVLKTEFYQSLDTRYSLRPFRIATKSLRWILDDNKSDWSTSYGEELIQLLAVDVRLKDSTPRLVHPEKFRCIYAAASFSSFEIEGPFLFNIVRLQSNCLTSVIESLNEDWRDVQSVEDDEKRIENFNSMQYVSQEFAHCMGVEYPEALEILLHQPELNGRKIIEQIIWLASATTPFNQNSNHIPWIRFNCDLFPSIVRNMISNECVLNNSRIIGPVIDAFLECGNHVDNPIESARACNGFVIACLLQLPLEVFSKSQREAILKAWPAAPPDSAVNDVNSRFYGVAPLDPAVLSLKAKMMRLPTLYKGIKFQELVGLAECIKNASSEPKVLLPIFSELADLSMSHALATSDQPKSAEYIRDMSRILEEWLRDSNKLKSTPSYAMIQLTRTVLGTIVGKFHFSHREESLPKKTLDKLLSSFTALLLSTVKRRLQKVEKLKNDGNNHTMAVYCALTALSSFGVSEPSLDMLRTAITPSLPILRELNPLLCRRVESFLVELAPKCFDVESFLGIPMVDDIMTIDGRQSIKKKIVAITKNRSETETLQWMNTFLEKALLGPGSLISMLALRHTIAACQDSRDVLFTPNKEANTLSLSFAYSTLVFHLRKCQTIQLFCLNVEIMEMILRNKSHSVTQYNVDISLSSITSMCTRIAPSLPSRRAGTIYLHLVRLLHALLTSHRLKLQGRYHMLILSLTSLLRCLFVFHPTNTNYPYLPPPWLPRHSEPLKFQLNGVHAAALTRLVTLICSPTLSAVSRSSAMATASLHNPTSKAKHQAAQHMPVLLSSYIHMQLDMSLKMESEVREALVPAVYAVFDTMGREERRALGEGMDASGRAVLGTMIKDWVRWGKWKGN